MTKDEYLLIRDRGEVHLTLFFDFYRERGGKLDNIKDFEKVLVSMISNHSITQSIDGQPKQVSFNSVLNNFYNYYNEKFGV